MRSPLMRVTITTTTLGLLWLTGWAGSAIACPPPVPCAACQCECGCTHPDYGPQPIDRADMAWPLPTTVFCLRQWPTPGAGSINFQTDLSLTTVLAFYREALTAWGWQELTLYTTVTDDVFSLVFQGEPGQLPLVIQSVDLGGRINVNLRLEALASP